VDLWLWCINNTFGIQLFVYFAFYSLASEENKNLKFNSQLLRERIQDEVVILM
jgi:hypothetical protein